MHLLSSQHIAIMSNLEFTIKQTHWFHVIWIAFLSYLTPSRSKIRGLNDAEAVVLPLWRIVRTTGGSENIRPFSNGCHSQTTSALSASRIYGAPLDTPPDGSSIFREPTFRHFGSALPNAHKYSHLPDVLREPPLWITTCIFNHGNL